MQLSFYLRKRGWPITEVPEQSMFDPLGDKILLVENQWEEEVMEAMQFIYGSELLITIKDPDKDIDDYLKLFSRVYTTWDPNDRNRI